MFVQEKFAYDGAFVIPPDRGFYQRPIATLDFESLYPSIMRAHNLCYSTVRFRKESASLVIPNQSNSDVALDAKLVAEVDTERTPAGHEFVRATTRRGVLPDILTGLLAARKKVKNEMKTIDDPSVYKQRDCLQLALKVFFFDFCASHGYPGFF